ncbi:hypothetical protein DSO57_1014911 [Entomophthora muscae]|uniref:Uncharacterized protein n=1 Tax=Entomophthora muscae TaxID=34485 RepID=A0ACC2T5B6_9FUNG|nr:hypothetical protein DSO57_1014911 [Entomophthora muscae]
MALDLPNGGVSRKGSNEDVKSNKLSARLKRLLPSSRSHLSEPSKTTERSRKESEELSVSSNEETWIEPPTSQAKPNNLSGVTSPVDSCSRRDSPTKEPALNSNNFINEDPSELRLEDLKWLPNFSNSPEAFLPRTPPAISLALDRYNEDGESLDEHSNVLEEEEPSKAPAQNSSKNRGPSALAELQMDPVQKKRNIDFHINFPSLPLDDILIEDWHCALQKDILVTGRLYVTQERICFHSNLFGWVNHTIIPFSDIVSLQKRSTAFVIPNAIQIITLDQKYFFTSFMSRDSAYTLLYELWFRKCPNRAIDPAKLNLSEAKIGSNCEAASSGAGINTLCACLKTTGHAPTINIDTIPISLTHFTLWIAMILLLEIGKNDDTRNISFIKPLHNPLGPKQTRCLISQKIIHQDFEDYCIVEDRTSNPDVPSGDAFIVVSRYCIMRQCTTQCRLITSVTIEWSKSSWFKGPIESGTKEGTTKAAHELDAFVRKYLDSHPDLVTVAVGSEPQKCELAMTKEDNPSQGTAKGFKLWPPTFRTIMGVLLVVLVGFYVTNWVRVGSLQSRISQVQAPKAPSRPVSQRHLAHLRELQANLRALGGQLEEIESRLTQLRQDTPSNQS